MSMIDWAKREVELACKKENPNWDGESFDYGCACYQSALKAYNILADDEHSGASWSFTRSILMALMDGRPLTPITEDDAFNGINIDSTIEQCSRLYSLFRTHNDDGTITYSDTDRLVCVDAEEPSSTFHCGLASDIVDEMFPISLPYYPTSKKYMVYMKTFLTDRKNGDFDTNAVLYIVTPDGDKVPVNRYFAYDDNDRREIDEDEYLERFAHRLDRLNEKAAYHIIWTVTNNSSTDDECDRRSAIFDELSEKDVDKIYDQLAVLCEIFNEHPELNTFDNIQSIARGASLNEHLQGIQDFIKAVFLEGIYKK